MKNGTPRASCFAHAPPFSHDAVIGLFAPSANAKSTRHDAQLIMTQRAMALVEDEFM